MSEMKRFSDDILFDKGLHTNGMESQKIKVQIEKELKGGMM